MGKRSALLWVELYSRLRPLLPLPNPPNTKDSITPPPKVTPIVTQWLSCPCPGNLPLQFFCLSCNQEVLQDLWSKEPKVSDRRFLETFCLRFVILLNIHNSVEIDNFQVLIEIDKNKYFFKLFVKYYFTFSRNYFLITHLLQIIFFHFSKS